jgi:GDPmannose 4,6-dehydratase
MQVLVIGVTGQTAAYVVKKLLSHGFAITGTTRDRNRCDLDKLFRIGVQPDCLNLISLDPADPRQVFSLLARNKYKYIINLAGQTSVRLSFSQPAHALDSISTSCLNFIEAIRALSLESTYFNASSSECFGNTGETAATEETPFQPNSPYAVAKASAFHLTRLAREAYGIPAFSGILSNHESPLRGKEFVTSKIFERLRAIKDGAESRLVLGNLKTTRDWGFAPDYARAIVQMLHSGLKEDVIIATGESQSLIDFIKAAAEALDIKDNIIIDQDQSLIRPLDVEVCNLNPSKINRLIGWSPSCTFKEMVAKLAHNKLF